MLFDDVDVDSLPCITPTLIPAVPNPRRDDWILEALSGGKHDLEDTAPLPRHEPEAVDTEADVTDLSAWRKRASRKGER